MTRPDRTVLRLSYNGMECAQLPATAAYWAEWKGTRLTSLSRTLWDDVQNPCLFKGPAGVQTLTGPLDSKAKCPAGTFRLLVDKGCSPVAAGQYKSRRVLDVVQLLAAFAV